MANKVLGLFLSAACGLVAFDVHAATSQLDANRMSGIQGQVDGFSASVRDGDVSGAARSLGGFFEASAANGAAPGAVSAKPWPQRERTRAGELERTIQTTARKHSEVPPPASGQLGRREEEGLLGAALASFMLGASSLIGLAYLQEGGGGGKPSAKPEGGKGEGNNVKPSTGTAGGNVPIITDPLMPDTGAYAEPPPPKKK